MGGFNEPTPVDFDKEKAFLEALEPLRNSGMTPTVQRKYPKMNRKEWTPVDFIYKNEVWPDEEDCRSNNRPLPSLKDVHVFLSPNNKGFE